MRYLTGQHLKSVTCEHVRLFIVSSRNFHDTAVPWRFTDGPIAFQKLRTPLCRGRDILTFRNHRDVLDLLNDIRGIYTCLWVSCVPSARLFFFWAWCCLFLFCQSILLVSVLAIKSSAQTKIIMASEKEVPPRAAKFTEATGVYSPRSPTNDRTIETVVREGEKTQKKVSRWRQRKWQIGGISE